MKYIYKLGVKANSFTDPQLGISITRTTPYQSDEALHLFSLNFSRAVSNGHIIVDQVGEEPTIEQLDVATCTAEQLTKLTVKEITAVFNFIDEEDTAELTKISAKADKIAFLIEIRDSYEFGTE